MTCCTSILELPCAYSCDLVQIGINAPATGVYTLVLMPDLIQVVSTTITISTPIYFSGGYLNEDGRSIFKVKKPDGTYLTSGDYDCFQIDIRPTVNATLADLTLYPVTCEVATAVLKNSALTTISTTEIASGATANITAPDASAVLKNSANTTISTTAIPSNTSSNITAPDATAVLKNTLGTVIDTEAIPSNVSEDITIPNVSWTDTDGSAESTPYGNAIVCSPCAGLTVNFSANDTTPETNQTVTFTDLTTGATTWLWDFGDGNLSDLQNPTHEYKYAGTYTVTLHADNGSVGGYEEKVGYIVVTLQTLFQTNLQMWNKAGTGASPSNMTLVSGAVSQWNDETAGAFHRTQAVAASRPTYNQTGYTAPDGTVYGTVEYDGALGSMKNNSAGLTRAAGSYEVVVLRIRASTNGSRVYFEAGNASLYEAYIFVSGAVVYSALVLYLSSASSVQSAGIAVDEFILVKVHWNGASSSIQINNLTRTVITNNIGTGAGQGSTQGSGYAGAGHGKSDFLEHAIYSAKPSDADIIAYIDNYFNSKFGLWE